MAKRFLRYALLVAMLLGFTSASAAFKGFSIDLRNTDLVNADEQEQWKALSFGFTIGDDNVLTRVAADDPSADVVLSGQYHGTDHGWAGITAVFNVDGPVKIGVSTCAFGKGDVSIKNSANEVVSTFPILGGENDMIYGFYKGEADKITVNFGSYIHGISVAAADPSELVEEVDITFANGDAEFEGTLPAGKRAEVGSSYVLPFNRTLFIEGKTLTGWNDGTTTYAPGTEITVPDANVVLTPVFADNAVTLADRTSDVTILWDFQQKNGAPVLSYQGKTGFYVTQAEVNGNTIDVRLDFDTTSGKLNNAAWQDWAQINNGTKFQVPACKDAVISMFSMSKTTTSTIDGSTDYTAEGSVVTYVVDRPTNGVEIVIGDGSYWRYIQVVLPYVAPAADAFKGFTIDLRNTDLVNADEQVQWKDLSFGFTIGDDNVLTRVAADDPSADVVLSGKYHGTDHGWACITAVFNVDGPVKIGVSTCAFGKGDVSIKNSANEVVSTFPILGGENDMIYGFYKGEADKITVNFGSYIHGISIVPVDPAELVSDVKLTFSMGDVEAEGTVPAEIVAESGSKFTIPANYTIYAEGKTLKGWTDGTNEYLIGQDYTTPDADATLTPIFADNEVTLAGRKSPVTIKWNFRRDLGCPVFAIEGNTGFIVAQADVDGQMIDVKLPIDATTGKFNNASHNDWVQINNGTRFEVPSCVGAVISMEAYSEISTTTIDGQTDYATGKVISYTIGGDAAAVDVVVGNGSYYRYIQVVLPVVASQGGTSYTDEPASVIWPFNSSADYATNYTATPSGDNGFSIIAASIGDAKILGTETGQIMDGKSDGLNFLKLQPANNASDVVTWSVTPAQGLTFTPTKFSLHVCRFGTDAENGVTVKLFNEDGEALTFGPYTALRNTKTVSKPYDENKNATSFIEIELTAEQQAQLATSGALTLSSTIGVNNSRSGGICDVRIYGVLNGTIENVNKYAVTAEAYPAEAATVSLYPKAEQYNEGTQVKVSAVPNFGYHFINWTDADNNELSTEPVFTLTVDKAYDLTANFEAVNTYELKYAVEGGANLYMVEPTPAPTVIDGKNMYEEGTEVSLVASSNPIMTFTNWSDGQTSGEIKFAMNEDVDLTASYSAGDFIVGWDFIMPGANGRPADFAATDNDAVSLTLRTDDGESSGWLDKSQKGAGGYEGRPGAVNWRTGEKDGDVGNYYFQTKVNAAAFTDIKVQTSSVYNYNSYTKYDIQYSFDGAEWNTVASLVMGGAKSWTDVTAELPAEANNQAELYIRWYPDRDSNIDGTASKNDGFCLGATYITGTPKLIDDGTAPVLVSTVPVEGATNASANGKVVLTFDEKVKVAEGAVAKLSDATLTPSVTGKVVTFEYKGLSYSTDYTFTLAGGSVMDLTDNAIAEDIVINFTTKTRPVVSKGLYDFIVPDDGNFREAVEAANSRADKSTRYRIFVKQGDYLVPTKGERPGTNKFESNIYPDPRLDLSAANVSIIGESLDNTSVTNICPEAVDGLNPIEGLRNAYTLHNTGTGTYIQDLMLINGLADNTGRGEAYEESGDKTILKNVGLWGYQDTYCSNNGQGRYYFEGGVVRGRTDYICGRDDIFFNGVEFRNCAAGYIAVPSAPKQYGWILRDCHITVEDADACKGYTLGRPWGSGTPIAIWINTVCDVIPSDAGWSEMSGGWPARFAEYNTMTSTGTPVDLSNRKNVFGDGHANNPILTAAEADFYTVANVLSGDDDWDPTEATEQASAPTNALIDNSGVITWDNNDYVLLWAICRDGKVIDFTTEPTYSVDDTEAAYSVRAANEMGGLGEAAIVKSVDSIISVDSAATVVSTVTYNLQGQRVANNYTGAAIRVETLTDGTVITTKVVK